MTENKNQTIIFMSNFLLMSGFNGIDPKEFEINKYTCNSSMGCVFEVDLQYTKELRELHNDYPLDTDKIEIKNEILSKYQFMISDFYNIPISNNRKWCLTFLIKRSI